MGTFGSVVKYIKERESANLSLISSSQDQIVLNLTDTLDDAIFDEPLTIRSEVPSSWAKVRVKQGTGAITVTPGIEGTKTVIYYNVIPDRGFITLQKLTYQSATNSLWSQPFIGDCRRSVLHAHRAWEQFCQWFNGEME